MLNSVRIPVEKTVFGPLIFCPLHALGFVLSIRYDKETNLWQPKHKVEGLEPANLIFHIDVPGEDPRLDEVGSYALIPVGKWVGQGLTILSMETVCLLVRLVNNKEFTKDVGVIFGLIGLDREQMVKFPSVDNSYTRVGLVRGAGLADAWTKMSTLIDVFFLF